MPLTEPENLIYRLTDPSASSSTNRDEDSENLLKNMQADAAVLAHCLRYLAHKVQSPSERESLKALDVLDHIVKKGGRIIHAEVGKFRFLNELIKVISPKYLGEKTTEEVKKKTTVLLFTWSQSVRYESKIVEAYGMLKQQGIIRDDPVICDPTPPPPPRPKNPIIEDEEKSKLLRRLLQSKDPADMVAANRLIKNMVREDDQRTERIVRRHADLTQIQENAKVLGDMLRHHTTEQSTSQEREIMRQLFDSCELHRPRVFKLAAEVAESTSETEDGPSLAEVLAMSDELTEVIQQYKVRGLDAEKFGQSSSDTPSSTRSGGDLVALEPPVEPSRPTAQIPQPPKDDVKNLLDEIFAADSTTTGNPPLLPPPVVEPVAQMWFGGVDALPQTSQSQMRSPLPNYQSTPPAFANQQPLTRKSLVEFDDVTNNFLGGLSLGERSNAHKGKGFPVETKSKPSLSELQKVPTDSNRSSPSQTTNADDGAAGSGAVNRPNGSLNGLPAANLENVVVHLSDIKPASAQPVVFYQRNQITIALYLAQNKPKKDVTVFVVAVSSHNSIPVRDFLLQFNGSKTTIIKASPVNLPEIPPFNPIFPSSPNSSVILVTISSKDSPMIRYSVSYNIGNQSVSDSGFVDIPDDLTLV